MPLSGCLRSRAHPPSPRGPPPKLLQVQRKLQIVSGYSQNTRTLYAGLDLHSHGTYVRRRLTAGVLALLALAGATAMAIGTRAGAQQSDAQAQLHALESKQTDVAQ